jgi:hypothetical protein
VDRKWKWPYARIEESHDKLSAYRTAVNAVGTKGPVQQTVQTLSRLPVSRDTPTAPTHQVQQTGVYKRRQEYKKGKKESGK